LDKKADIKNWGNHWLEDYGEGSGKTGGVSGEVPEICQ
jgi:hypothetical protein